MSVQGGGSLQENLKEGGFTMNSRKLLQRLYYTRIFIFTCFVCVATSLQLLAQELPILTKVEITASVIQQPSGIYEYNYTVKNLSTTQAELRHFEIDIAYPPQSILLNDQGLTNGPGYAEELSRVGPSLFPDTPSMIPVGLWSPPNWVSGLGRKGTANWGSRDRPFRVLPTQQLNGFSIHTYGLPGIRSFRAEPWIDIDTLYPSVETMTQEQADELTKKMKEDEEVTAFKGKTLGPTAPPAQFVALDFLTYLVNLKHQAAELGWITNKGVENSLDVKLDQVKKKLQSGDTKTTSNVLKAFINEVNAQGCPKYEACPPGKHLLPEAWALLKFNAEFLLSRL